MHLSYAPLHSDRMVISFWVAICIHDLDNSTSTRFCCYENIINGCADRHLYLSDKGVAVAGHWCIHERILHHRPCKEHLLRHHIPTVDPPNERHFPGLRHLIANLLCDQRATGPVRQCLNLFQRQSRLYLDDAVPCHEGMIVLITAGLPNLNGRAIVCLCNPETIVHCHTDRHLYPDNKGVPLAHHRRVHDTVLHLRPSRAQLLRHHSPAVDAPHEKHLTRLRHVIADLLGDDQFQARRYLDDAIV